MTTPAKRIPNTTIVIDEPRGSMPVLQFCTPAQLRVDASYQRPTDAQPSRTLINRITARWDWRLYQPLVVARRVDGNLYVVDGQHRLEAARQRGDISQLPCVVIPYDSAEEEANAFVALNQQRRSLSKLNVFKAALVAGDTDARLLASLIERAGLRLTASADPRQWKPGWINNIVAIRSTLRRHGEKTTRAALDTLARSFEGQVLRYGGTLFAAIVPVVVANGDALSTALLIDLLRDADQDGWMERFRTVASQRGIGVQLAAQQVLAETVAEALAE